MGISKQKVRDRTKRLMPIRRKKTARLNLLIREDLKKWIHKYADRMDKSVSAIVTEHFIKLRSRERREKVYGVEVEQI